MKNTPLATLPIYFQPRFCSMFRNTHAASMIETIHHQHLCCASASQCDHVCRNLYSLLEKQLIHLVLYKYNQDSKPWWWLPYFQREDTQDYMIMNLGYVEQDPKQELLQWCNTPRNYHLTVQLHSWFAEVDNFKFCLSEFDWAIKSPPNFIPSVDLLPSIYEASRLRIAIDACQHPTLKF